MKNTPSPLSKEILSTSQTLISSISKLPPGYENLKKIDGIGGPLSARNLLAYQIGWGRLLIGWYEHGLRGETPEMPGDGFSSWRYRDIALHFYQKYHLRELQKQVHDFEIVVQTITAFVDKEQERGYLDALNVWSWCTLKSGKAWPLSKWVRVNTVAPYKKASAAIRKLLREAS